MATTIITDPILNSPFIEPTRHFRFDDDGITNEIVNERRDSAYFVPIPRAKKRSNQQLALATEWTQDRIEENRHVNRIRQRVNLWRQGGYVGVTPTTRRLLQHWTDPDRENKLFFCQIEALETAIYIAEVANKYGDAWIANELVDANNLSNPGLPRQALKMATGSGKTVVMAMLIAWQALNKLNNPQDARYADSAEGVRKEAELTGQTPPSFTPEGDVRKGFVYRRVPHVTLKSIANNPDIREGMTREEIDGAIARHAETETLYDQPYEDTGRVRVSGPFTVESLSPHRALSAADADGNGHVSATEADQHSDFATMILDNLRRAGVQNGFRGERLTFDRLDAFAGTWVHAIGEAEIDGEPKRIAVSLGPEHGTVGPAQVQAAAVEARKGYPADILVVCGFAFDAHVSEEVKNYGKLVVLPVKMNPDLSMGDELLKKTGSGNLFMVFGEPDVDIRRESGQVVVEIRGVDVYDPTTGAIRSNSTDDIACWFIDTNYDDTGFFVRHAYFTGSDQPYERLKRALRAEIDEDAWASLYQTASRPFDVPSTGKIAVKIINHYGDEVMKVYEV